MQLRVGMSFGDNRELVAPQPRNHVVLTQDCLHPPGNIAQHAIAGLMAIGVIYPLEFIQIEQHQRTELKMILRVADGSLQIGGKSPAIGQAGQGILSCE